MAGVLKQVKLPGEALAWNDKLKLSTWVDTKNWDPEPRYLLITTARSSWDAMGRPELADDPEVLVGCIYRYLLKDEQFKLRIVTELKQQITDTAEWEEVTKAYAWVILQRYNRELREVGGQDD